MSRTRPEKASQGPIDQLAAHLEKKITINLKTTVLLTPEEIDSATKLTLTYSPLGKQGHVKIWGLQS